MALLAVVGALATALCIGYFLGRRAGSARPTWKKRTSRVAVGRLALGLLVAFTARRIQHSFRAQRVFPGGVLWWGLRSVVPLELLRGSVARMRSY